MKKEILALCFISCLIAFGCSGTKTIEKEVKNDQLNLGISTLRSNEVKKENHGDFKIEALKKDGSVMFSFEWTYTIQGKDEIWKVLATRTTDRDNLISGELTYGIKNGKEFEKDNLSKDEQFVEMFYWIFKKDKEASNYPSWLGEFSFTANQYQLLSRDDCVSCDTPFCSC